MNRIYKVVWSKAKNCYTVVSEIAKRHGKGNRARTCAAAFLAAFALTGVMGMSEAQASDANVVNANTLNAKYNLNVGEPAANGYMPFFVDSNGAFHAAANEFSVNKDGKVTATEGEIGGVTIKEGNITGVKAINTSAINTNVLNSKYNLSVGTANENGTMPFFVNSNGAFYAANGKLVVDKDGNVTAGNVVLKNGVYTGNSKLIDGELYVGDASTNYSQITTKGAKLGKVTIDENGNIAGANSIQTNALNAKYNLSVGTANENGTVPFFVNSNGAFYAANGKLVVDKDGKVTATEGEIGNVVLKNGVLYKNTALRDGELYVGDASGNYSQITPKSAKLGQVTIDENGNMAGVNSIQTNALNAKYNLSVGTANENGTVPFFVNSNGAFYAANGKLVVDKDGKVTATEGEIGNVVLKNGVLYKNTALRDGELYVGDASGNYSQITPKSAKLGQVTIDENGNMAGVNSIQTNALNAKYNLSVGTANENGTVPFFVNSNGAFYAANGKLVVDKDGKVTATEGEIGGVKINKGISYKNTSLRDGSLYLGDDQGHYSQISPEYAKLGKVTINKEGKITGVAAGAVTADSTDAVNGSQLHAVQQEAGKHTKVVNGSNITVEETDQDGQKTYKVGLNKDILLGDITGNNVSISGTNGTIETTGYIATKDRIIADKGAQLAGINVSGNIISNGAARIALYGDSGVAGMVNGKGASLYMQDGNTIINSKVAIDQKGKITGVAAGAVTADSTDAVNGSQLHAVATDVAQNKTDIAQNKADIAQNKADIAQNKADIAQNKADIAQNKTDIAQNKADIAQNKADIAQNKTDIAQNKTDIAQNKAEIGKLDNRVTNVENLAKQHTTVEAGNNITVTESTNADGGKKYTVGMAKDITVDSVKVGDNTYVSKDGLNANNQTITNVKDGKIEEGSKDAVNGGQLYATNQLVKENASNISLLGNSINKLDNRVDKVGAGAAALAALHPLDFDPEDKWDFAAGYGNYSGASAVALGAYYRPNEDTMFSVGGSFGNGENMVNAGISLKLGQSNHAPASKAAMEKKISALSQEVEELKAAIADLRAAQTKAKDATEKDAQKK